MPKYKIILTNKGKGIFKGGNIEVMEKPLIEFESNSLKEANKIYDELSLTYSLMNYGYYELIEVKNVT